ncbi:MAG: hypothetical protein IPP88_03330 [Betaproteobacteria bacterium]|nr:hypothetical protein [Betaproteobacteria bacterium]
MEGAPVLEFQKGFWSLFGHARFENAVPDNGRLPPDIHAWRIDCWEAGDMEPIARPNWPVPVRLRDVLIASAFALLRQYPGVL